MTSVAEAMAETLHSYGVRVVFGLPGGETCEVLDAIRRQGIRFVLVHSESAAVFMADAAARLTGIPGICLTTLGPGASNAIVGVSHAYLDRSPIVIITAQKPDQLLPDYTHQVLDLHQLFKPITKATIKVTSANVYQSTRDALLLALGGRPGPVHLQVSNEEASTSATCTPCGEISGSNPLNPPSNEQLGVAREILTRARRPLIIAGLGLEPEGPYETLRHLAEDANAPVIVTPKAKGCISDEHLLSAGTIGLTLADPVCEVLDEADCIIAVGFDVVELVKPWNHPAPLIWVAPWANQDPTLPAAAEFVGDIEPILQQFTGVCQDVAADWGAARIRRFRRPRAGTPLPQPTTGRMFPQTVLSTLRSLCPPDAVLAVDVGSHKICSSLMWKALVPNRFLVSNGLSSMGFSLPAAIGASIAKSSQPVLCLTGDAGLAMTLGELGVLSRLGAHVIVVVLNDGAIDLIRSHQVRAGKPVFGTEFTPPIFTKIAEAYGILSRRVSDESGLAQALEVALSSRAPFLIEVMLDPRTYPTTPPSAQLQ